MARLSIPKLPALFFVAFLGAFASHAAAQDNYEIQVYGSETVAPRTTMFEIHSNFTVEGSKTVQDGLLPTEHAEHETLEITLGRSGFLSFQQYPIRRRLAVGGRSHSTAGTRA